MALWWRFATSATKPVAPAAGSPWPTFPLYPTRVPGSVRMKIVDIKDAVSMGSPSDVPVPCASMTSTDSEQIAAPATAARISICCERPLGAVRLALRPSCLTALPRTPTLALSTVALSTTPQHASARAYPSARLSKVQHRPRADVIPARAKRAPATGLSIRLTPNEMAYGVHSMRRNASDAMLHAASAAEHAVSIVRQGPVSPRT
mmetsp:Transcript_3393/g.7291  ORF Transcript_3393/g.7291 Transcript_3393/m.7291 type:complete len:205 (+) Transcript_3393:5045-5659(+)